MILLSVLTGLAACGGDDDDDSGDPTETVASATAATPAYSPEQTGDGTVTTPVPLKNQEELERQAADLCPPDFLDACSAGFLGAAAGDLAAALCVTDAKDSWFIETPGGTFGEPAEGVEIGDDCASDETHKVVAFLNYP